MERFIKISSSNFLPIAILSLCVLRIRESKNGKSTGTAEKPARTYTKFNQKLKPHQFHGKDQQFILNRAWALSLSPSVPSYSSTSLSFCDEHGSPIHYATECPLTSSHNLAKPTTDLKQLWWQRVMLNPLFWALSVMNKVALFITPRSVP
ncbi:hypothetical protein AVEN_66498-1 [Araneus ventricosus]|uniref:Uncharacterized protein n=1 Tax=Araneus ventricosus TaxID=182803 RepID=A0A4Y2P7W2_ARAVE|nr:hypothetical protein AVEN_66498-1 [Araneus ventricosus]